MLYRVDSDGFLVTMLEVIKDYAKDDTALDIANKYVVTPKGRQRLWKTNKGQKSKDLWTNSSELQLLLKDLKESNLVEFIKARGLEKEPIFCWYVPYELRKRDIIISNITSRVQKITHKYGIEIPTSIEDAKRLDANNENDF